MFLAEGHWIGDINLFLIEMLELDWKELDSTMM